MNPKYCASNPIITPDAVPALSSEFEVVGSFNPGVTMFGGEVLLLVRVAERVLPAGENNIRVPVAEDGGVRILSFDKADNRYDFSDVRIIKGRGEKYLTSMSRLMVATSADGVHFKLHPDRCLVPQGEYEKFGIEDPRITRIGADYFITYSAISPLGICTALVTTRDFRRFARVGNVLCPDNKDAALFPEKIGGKYYMIHRPSTSEFAPPEMWIAESDNLKYWGNHRRLMGIREAGWDSARIGVSSIPIRLDEGWLVLYHGADKGNRYCLGAILLGGDEPWRVLARTERPIMEPGRPYETDGFLDNVVFACGCNREGDLLHVYYGAADKYVCLADLKISDVLAAFGEEKR